jgi:hypothetical protein
MSAKCGHPVLTTHSRNSLAIATCGILFSRSERAVGSRPTLTSTLSGSAPISRRSPGITARGPTRWAIWSDCSDRGDTLITAVPLNRLLHMRFPRTAIVSVGVKKCQARRPPLYDDRLRTGRSRPFTSPTSKEKIFVQVEHPRGLFEALLSAARQSAEQMTDCLQELDAVRDTDINEALRAGVFISAKILETLDQCFKLIGALPVKQSGSLQDVFMEDFRLQLAEIRSPTARRLFVLVKTNQLLHLRLGEYLSLIACADMSGHRGVRLLLGTCLADNVVLIETTQRLIRNIIEGNGWSSAADRLR